ncbi:unnamed protein product, partial [Ixodes persulcatus]
MWDSRDYARLPPSPPPTCSTVPVSVAPEAIFHDTSLLVDHVVTNLDIVLANPQPVVVDVTGQQVVAVLQDVVQPSDILLQALRAADIPITPPTDSDSVSSLSQSSSEEEEDTWA